jgi:hypothetical protein
MIIKIWADPVFNPVPLTLEFPYLEGFSTPEFGFVPTICPTATEKRPR